MANTDTDLRCYLTNAGIAAENNAIALGRKLPIKEMVFGSGVLADGEDPRNLTTMISEQFKVPCAMITHSDNTTLLTFKGDIPVDVGGFNINEVAIRLEDGTIYGYARGTGDYKPTPEQGATESIRYVVDMYSTNVTVIECKVDLSNVYADYEDLEAVRKEAESALGDHLNSDEPHSEYEKKENAASDIEIDETSTKDKHVKLPQLWRAFFNKVKDASLTVKGIVTLSNDLDSDSEKTAATSQAVKTINDKLTFGFSIKLSQNGFVAFPDFLGGFILQWGAGYAAPDSSDLGYANVLPMAYPTKQLVAIGIHTGGDAKDTNIINNTRPTTHAYFESAYGSQISIMYISVGY